MASATTLRTAAFRLDDTKLGQVHLYRAGTRFNQEWERLTRGRRDEGKFLPISGLATALRILTGDFVAVQRKIVGDRAFIVSRRQIDPAVLEMAIGAWETYALERGSEALTEQIDDLHHDLVDVAEGMVHRPGRCPTIVDESRWTWDVAIWDLAHRMAEHPLPIDDGVLPLVLDSEGTLLRWDRLLHTEHRDPSKTGAAMHQIKLHLITIPGVEHPVVTASSNLVRLAPSWQKSRGAKRPWVQLDPSQPLLRIGVSHRPAADVFTTTWWDRTADVLRGASLDPLPDPNQEPTFTGPLRVGYRTQPRYHPIGRGVGTWFHEYVARQLANIAGGPDAAVDLRPRRPSYPSVATAAPRRPFLATSTASRPELKLQIFYATSPTRRRICQALMEVLGNEAHQDDEPSLAAATSNLGELADGEALRVGPIEVQFIKPPDAEAYLRGEHDESEIRTWLATWLPAAPPDSVTAAIVETRIPEAPTPSDPKPILRSLLAGQGIVTQFITSDSAPSEQAVAKARKRDPNAFVEHSAANTVLDALRGGGCFLRPFPLHGLDEGTLVVGVFGIRHSKQSTGAREPVHITSLVAVNLGTTEAWAFTDEGGWLPLGQATAQLHSTSRVQQEVDARRRVERAVKLLPAAFGDRPSVLLFDAVGCRRHWSCLSDKAATTPERWMTQGGSAVVRVRDDATEVLRPAGGGAWEDAPREASYRQFKPMTIDGHGDEAPTYVVSGSMVMSRTIQARKSTRCGAPASSLKDDWHALRTTELHVLDPGSWQPATLIDQIAMLCRVAPSWSHTLRWPSPLHLARAIVKDHPSRYLKDDDDEPAEPAQLSLW